MGKVIAITNQKGGCAKTTTTVNLGAGLTRMGYKVALIDADPQGSLTASLGFVEPDELGITLANIMMNVINEEEIDEDFGILHHKEGMDLIPANIELSALEISLTTVMSREYVLADYIETIKDKYDYILIDCMPSLGMLTMNSLVAADTVLIPIQAAYLPVKGLQQLMHTISMVKKRLNKKLQIEGILLAMMNYRFNYSKDISARVFKDYGSTVGVFSTYIPTTVKVAEASAKGVSMFTYCPKCKATEAYELLAKEIVENGK